jgi:hypothetical protein
MKSISFVILLTSIFLCSSCEKSEIGYILDSSVTILYIDPSGNNLFNPDSGLLSDHDIQIYYMKQGEKKRSYNGFVSHSEYYKEGPVIAIRLNHLDYNDLTIIELGGFCTDTIKAEYSVGKHYRIATKIWYNDELVCDVSNPTVKQKERGNYVEIKKDNFK